MAPPETQPNSAPETDEEPTDEALAKVEKEETEQKEEVDPDAFAPELNAIAIYLHALRKNPLLNPEEEVELSKQIDPVREEYMALFSGIEKLRMRVEDKDILPTEEDVERLELLRRELGKYDFNERHLELQKEISELRRLELEHTRLRELERELKKHDGETPFSKAVNRLISGNLRLVVSIAKRYMNFMPLLECVSVGNLGLRKASIKFDWRRGNKFATYATWWIRQGITREISDRKATIRIPVNHTEILRKIGRAVTGLNSRGNLGPTDEDIAEEVNAMQAGLSKPKTPVKPITAKQIKYIRERGRLLRCVELNKPASGADDSDHLIDVVTDTDTEGKDHTRGQDADLTDLATRQIAERLLKTLDLRTETIMRERFLEGKTLDAVGEELNLTRERIRQIQKKTLEKLLSKAEALYNGEDGRKGH